ncbi:hypothetical protein [Pseudomonas weihenstephanensis]|uniref:hypothetical protein n=1 Tax=Pseudomonas weihenstephanensis TaxID=1608994 RepID=UPI00193BF7C3|nr:hypothetical protein [Pseudomonas weihenstephanensis]MBM1191521.1 hypothetical protein [Pseudomonas weihenstephanensis]
MDFSRVVGNPEVIDRCSLILEGGGMSIQFAPEGLKLLGRMSIDRIYIEGKTLVIHQADPATEKQGRSGAGNDHSDVGDRDGFAGESWGRVDGVM